MNKIIKSRYAQIRALKHRCQATTCTLNFNDNCVTKTTLKLQAVHSGQTPYYFSSVFTFFTKL